VGQDGSFPAGPSAWLILPAMGQRSKTHEGINGSPAMARDGSAGPRARTRLDDLLTRTVGRLPPLVGAAAALGVYVVLGIALPLALNAGRLGFILFGFLGASWATVVLLAALFAAKQASDRRRLIEWTSDLRKLDATEFEWLVGELLRREGWNVTETGRVDGPDGNVDLRAAQGQRVLVVQCKRWAAKPVGVDEVRKLAGTTSGERSGAAAVLVTLSDFTEAAINEGKRLRVDLVDGDALLARIDHVRQSEACPLCATPMILERSSRGWWLRCPRFPACSGKRNLASEPGAAVDLLLSHG
jgi:HJR/Mrr/RecB family endonuclease